MRCYICNKELVENVTEANQCKSHGEHIIHNGIRGKLISNQILCENCGCDYSRDDAAFCKIFAPFIAALKDRLIPADHGRDTLKTLSGSLFDNLDSKLDLPSRQVNIRGDVVTPVEPYYEIEDDVITVYADKCRIDQYINVFKTRSIAGVGETNIYFLLFLWIGVCGCAETLSSSYRNYGRWAQIH